MSPSVSEVAALLERSGVEYAIIGAHAVNVWLEPRFTADIDVTAQLDPTEMARLIQIFAEAGISVATQHGADLASGPDFVRLTSGDGRTIVEVQSSKTAFQRELLQRARRAGGVRVASPEDLIVMKLIADRPKDQLDVLGLLQLCSLDWEYIQRWARHWNVDQHLARLRALG